MRMDDPQYASTGSMGLLASADADGIRLAIFGLGEGEYLRCEGTKSQSLLLAWTDRAPVRRETHLPGSLRASKSSLPFFSSLIAVREMPYTRERMQLR